MEPQHGQLVCAQCQSRAFIEVGFSFVCQCCGLQMDKQARYETDDQNFPSNPKAKKLGLRKRNTIKERGGKRERRKEAEKPEEDWTDYLEAYQHILKLHADSAKHHLPIETPNAFERSLKALWFGYLEKWAASGARLRGGVVSERRGCFAMPVHGAARKRYFIGGETGGSVVTREGTEEYEKLYEKDYENLKHKFYKRKHKKDDA
eukprot:TRINITY_DN8578_c0_g1_i9.p1 TRINITY_DN8578_c0_g1~~TRINITY_DN8578_c0_g1_i9.p1  ORF type:complete len:205 (-),score=58.16 TRINITY_DN8578_c0_g1_i9:102-716(-)